MSVFVNGVWWVWREHCNVFASSDATLQPHTHLDDVQLFGNRLIRHSETQRILQGLHQQQVTALQQTERSSNPETLSV